MYSSTHFIDCLTAVQGVSYYDQQLTVDLFDQLDWKSSGADTPLAYQSLIDEGLLRHSPVHDNDMSVITVAIMLIMLMIASP